MERRINYSLFENIVYLLIFNRSNQTMQKRDFKTISLRDFRLGVSPAESVRQTQKAFDEESVNIHTVRNWYAKFRLGDYSREDKHGGGVGFRIDDERLKQVVE